MKLYENCIELSDRHVMWDMNNSHLSDKEAETAYNILVQDCISEFEDIYGTRLLLLGRSGRHVCVENTPNNRKSYCRMQTTVKRQQGWLAKRFNGLKKLGDLDN